MISLVHLIFQVTLVSKGFSHHTYGSQQEDYEREEEEAEEHAIMIYIDVVSI